MSAAAVCLALVIDVSSSISDPHYQMQRDASADAAEQPAILRAAPVLSAIMFGSSAAVVVPPSEPRAFAAALRRVQRPRGGATNITAGLNAAIDVLLAQDCERRIADLSGDGRDNAGDNLADAVGRALIHGIEVNCLPVVTQAEPDIREWMAENVCDPAGGFTMAATWESYGHAIRNKMGAEVASR